MTPAATTGRLMLNMLGTLAGNEREMIVERVNDGIAASRKSGTVVGRPVSDPKVTAEKLRLVGEARGQGETAAEATGLVGWSRAPLYLYQVGQVSTRM